MATARLAGPSGGADVISGYEVDVGRVDVFHRNEAGSDREELRPLGLDIAPGSLRVSRRTCCAAGEHPGSCGGASGAALWLATGAGLSEAAPLSSMAGISADLVEKMIDLSGENAINRSRIEMDLGQLGNTLNEMELAIKRLANQLC